MALYKIDKSARITKQKKVLFDSERRIQKLVGDNLPAFFNLQFIATELQCEKYRLDTLAFDENLNSFVIIEYKNKASEGVTEQGLAYKSLIRKSPEFFVLQYNKKYGSQLEKSDFDWLKTRIIFISPDYTKYQEAIDFEDVPFELWKISQYENGLISLEPLKPIIEKKIASELEEKSQFNQRTIYSEEQHLTKPNGEIKEIYFALKKQIISLGDDVRIEPQKKYIAFKAATNFVDIDLQKSAIKCHLNLSFGELKDTKNIARNVSNIGHYGNGDYEIIISKSEEINYLMELVKQSYEKNK